MTASTNKQLLLADKNVHTNRVVPWNVNFAPVASAMGAFIFSEIRKADF